MHSFKRWLRRGERDHTAGLDTVRRRPNVVDGSNKWTRPTHTQTALNARPSKNTAVPWRYQPLNERLKEIRLVKAVIQPPKEPSEIISVTDYASIPAITTERKQAPEIIIETFPLASAPPYTALSYLYGPDVRNKSLTCAGSQLSVTSNLEYLLRRLTMFPGWYWADAICISQDDISEKNSQVQLMHEIYKTASSVVAFLGDPPGNLGVETLVALEALNDMIMSEKLPTQEARKEFSHHQARFRRLLSQPYFSRGWIIQEAAVNPNCSIWYGNADIPFRLLSSVVQGIQDQSGLFAQSGLGGVDLGELEVEASQDDLIRHFRQIDTISRLRTTLKNGKRVPLCRALALARSSRVTDPRDRVYAFLGFIDHELQERLRPDYSPENSIENVLTQCARVGITSEQAPEILMSAGYTKPELPSWVPDWSNYPRNAFHSAMYKCAGASCPVIRLDSNDHNAIIVRGAIIDKVTKLLKPRKHAFATTHPSTGYIDDTPLPPNMPESQRPFFLSLLQDTSYCMLAAEYISNSYPTGESPDDVVWRTITGDTGLATMGSERPVQDVDRIRAAAFSHLYRPKPRLAEPFRVTLDKTDQSELFSLADAYHQQVAYIQEGRRGGMTEKRYLAVLPDIAEMGDLIVLVLGVNMPLVLRRIQKAGQVEYQLIGEAFVHGIMDGELLGQTVGGADGGWTVKGAGLEDIRIV